MLSAHLVGFRFKIVEKVPIDWSKPYVICPNHTSILDITAICYLCPQQFSFMGKVELLKNPVTRIFFKTIDIVVDRKSRISAFRAFKKADEVIKLGKSVVIFPEGKIDDVFPPDLHEFKSGSFRIAIDNKIQILPVVIHNAWKILWDGGEKLGSKPGTVHITILPPIDTASSPSDQHGELQKQVYEVMKENFTYKP